MKMNIFWLDALFKMKVDIMTTDEKSIALTPEVFRPTVMEVEGKKIEVKYDKNGIPRRKDNGFFIPGYSGNPDGKIKGQKSLRRELMKKFGQEGTKLVDKLETIICYDWDADKKLHPTKMRPNFEPHHQLKALEMAMHYLFGKPSETMHVDQSVDLTIETKMNKVAKLINDNKDKLRVIQGGGSVDVITDI